jgi:hypothetical protein
MADNFQLIYEEYYPTTYDINKICEKSNKKRGNCVCVKCNIRRNKNKQTNNIGPLLYTAIQKLVAQKLKKTSIKNYIDISKGGTFLSSSSENKWEETGKQEELVNEFIAYLEKNKQIDYILTISSGESKKSPIQNFEGLIQYQFNLFLDSLSSNKVVKNLSNRISKILKSPPYSIDTRYKKGASRGRGLAYKVGGDTPIFREPTKKELDHAIKLAGVIEQTTYNPEIKTTYNPYTTSNLKKVVEIIMTNLNTYLPGSEITYICEKLCPLDLISSIESIYEDITPEKTGEFTLGDTVEGDMGQWNLERVEELLDSKWGEIYLKIMNQLEKKMETQIKNLEKKNLDGVKVMLSCLNWHLNKKNGPKEFLDYQQKDFAKDIGIPERTLKIYIKMLEELLSESLVMFKDETNSLAKALEEIRTTDIEDQIKFIKRNDRS